MRSPGPPRFSTSQRLFAHGGVFTVSRLVNRSIGIVLIPLYARYLGDDGYGTIDLLRTLGAFLALLYSQGLVFSWFRLRYDQKDTEQLDSFETTIVWYLALSALVGIGVVTLFGNRLAAWLTPGIPFYPVGFLTALGAGMAVFANLYERKLQALQKPVAFALFTAFRTALSLGLIVAFVALWQRGAAGKIEADCAGAMAVAIVSIYYLRPRGLSRFSPATVRQSLAYGLPILPHSLASLTNDLIDRVILNRLLGIAETGVYSMGYNLGNTVNILGVALNQAYSPIFINLVKDSEKARESGDTAAEAECLRMSARTCLLIPTIVACFSIFVASAGKDLLRWFTTPEFDRSWTVLGPTCAGMVAFSCYTVFNQALFYDTQRVRYAFVNSSSAAIVNILGNYLLIPRLGILGAALATCFSNTVLAVSTYLVSRGCVPIPHNWNRWFALLSLTAAALGLFWWIDRTTVGSFLILLGKGTLAMLFSVGVLTAGGVAPHQILRFFTALMARLQGKGR